MNRSLTALLVLTLAGCSPRVDRVDVFSGPRGSRPTASAPPSADAPVTVRVEISPRQTTLLAPVLTLRPLEAVPHTPPEAMVTPLTLTSDGPGGASVPYAITIPPGGAPGLSYGSSWRMDLTVRYRSLGFPAVLQERRDFTVRAPASCSAFDNGLEGWSIAENRIGYGSSLDDIRRWPQDTQTRFLTSVSLEHDTLENFPRRFARGPDVLFGSARFAIGGDQPEKFREWLVRNPYIDDKNHWIARIVTARPLAGAVSVRVKTDAGHPLRLRARASCTMPEAGNAPCSPDHADSADAVVKPGLDWQTVSLSADTSVFPARSASGIGQLLVLGDAADSDKRVWIDMVCPEPLR